MPLIDEVEPQRVRGAGPKDRVAVLAHVTGIGDAVHMAPSLAWMKGWGYDVHVSCRPFWQPMIERLGVSIIPHEELSVGWVPSHVHEFGWIIDVTGWTFTHEIQTTGVPTLDRVDQIATILGADPPSPFDWTRLVPSVDNVGAGPVVIALGGSTPKRTWPHGMMLQAMLPKINAPAVLIGIDPHETQYLDFDSLAMALLRAPVVVATDNGMLNLAAALGRPVVGLFGPTDEWTILHQFDRWADNRHLVAVRTPARDGESCRRPCHLQAALGYGLHGRCLTPMISECLAEISPRMVIDATNALLAKVTQTP